jgi:small subunit ribosomal protein S12
MATINQLALKNVRIKKKFKNKTPALNQNPQKKGICIKIFIRTPKKPNSAQRKVAKLKLSTKRKIEAYIPGIGHSLRQYSVVLIRGGRVPDLPGVKYHLIRGKFDFYGVKGRKTSRSLYGTKKKL